MKIGKTESVEQRCLRCYVSGRVQGVFFRACTQARAQELGLSGYARNRDDGRVEVLVCGRPDAVQTLADWLWEGPQHARVSAVECEPVEDGTEREKTGDFRTL